MITSCLECRRRKLKCDRLHPCSNCSKAQRDCVFMAPALDAAARLKLMELKEKMGSLERLLERDVAPRHGQQTSESKEDASEMLFAAAEAEGRERTIPDDEKDLEPTRLAVQDAAYEDEADDEMYDLGFRLGKMRMTERVGGFFRPRLADELSLSLGVGGGAESVQDPLVSQQSLRELSPMEPDTGQSYIAPSSEMLFGSTRRDQILLEFLPNKAATDRLMQQYWEAVHPVARIVHRPTFEDRYRLFWNQVNQGVEPIGSLQAIVFAAWFTAVISMPEHEVFRLFNIPQERLRGILQLGTEMALAKAHFLRTTKAETLQALVMYLIPMCRDAMSRAHSALVGTALRLAECAGLHRDPSDYDHPPVETHVRRLIWYQLCFLDLRTSEVQGPRVWIRREDYSTKFPLDLDDDDLVSAPLDTSPRWTDMTLSRIRFECQEMVRVIYVDRVRLEKKSISLTYVIGKVESFRKAMLAKYEPLFNAPDQTPIQRYAKALLSLMISKLYIALLHRYHFGVAVRMSGRLQQTVITMGLQHLEIAIEMETALDFQRWAWYSRAYHQFHVALLLLVEVFKNPLLPEADRIWCCLDYVYETPSDPPQFGGKPGQPLTQQELLAHRERKARMILVKLRDRMNVYRAMRKIRTPTTMNQPGLATPRKSEGCEDASFSRFHPHVDSTADSRQESGQVDGGNRASHLLTGSRQQDCNTGQDTSGSVNVPPSSPSMYFSTLFPSMQVQRRARQNLAQAQANVHAQTPIQSKTQVQTQNVAEQPNPYQVYGGIPFLQLPFPTQETPHRSSRDHSLESEAAASSSSGDAGLWFVPGAPDASAGTAPWTSPGTMSPFDKEDLPMLDINWDELDKLLPPRVNNAGDVNLRPDGLHDFRTNTDFRY